MTQLPLFNNDAIHRLMLCGYSERESNFLCLAGLQSGFFLRRQYCQFTGIRSGRPDAELVQKLLVNGHATAVAGCHKTVVYHLSARRFYTALCQGDNRNRRMRPADAIRNRLMGLDYVLDHPGPRYLATEQEKIAYFTSLDIASDALPSKTFRSPSVDSSTTRFFVDKYPIFVLEPGSTLPLVGFCFIDEGQATCSRFAAYLAQYSDLFSRLPGFDLIYVAASRNLFWQAENVFGAFLRGGTPMNLELGDVERLLSHFQDREDSDNGHWNSFDRTKLIRLRDERGEFSGPTFESLYGLWKTAGAAAVRDLIARRTVPRERLCGKFSSYLLPHNYELFGGDPERPNE